MQKKENQPGTSEQNTMADILMLRRRMLENQKSPDAYCDLGVAIIQSGDPKSAIVYLKQAIKLDPDHARSHYNLALAYQKLGFIDNALNAYEHVIRLNREDHQAWANVAVLFSERNQLEDAIRFYQKAVEIDPGQARTWSGLAMAQYLTGSYEDSIESARKAIDIDAEDFQSWQQLGLGYYALRQPEESRKAFLQALELDPNSEVTWNNLGNSYLLDNNPDQAEEAYRQAVRLNPGFTDGCFNLGELLFNRGDCEEAITWLNRVLEKNENDLEALEYLVKSLLKTSSPDAVQRIRQLIRLRGDNPETISMLADAYSQSGRKDREAKIRLKLASANPGDKENILKTSRLLLEQGNRDLAYSFLKSSLPRSAKDHRMWSTFAQIHLLGKNLEEEFECLTRSVKADPSDGRAWCRLGMIALENDSETTGFKYLKNAGDFLKNNAKVWSKACNHLLKAGHFKLANQCLEELIPLLELSPGIWAALFRMYRRYHRLGDLVGKLPELLAGKGANDRKTAICADLLLQFGYEASCENLLSRNLENTPQSGILLNRLCRLHLNRGNYDDAAELISKWLETNPEEFDCLLLKSELEFLQNNLEAALDLVRKAHSVKQDHYRSWYILGKIEQNRSNFRDALDALEQSLSCFQQDADVWFTRGEVQHMLDQLDEAEASFRNAVSLNRRFAEAWLALAEILLAESDYQGARKLLLRSVAAKRDFRQGWKKLAEIFDYLQDSKKAEVCRQQAENPTTDVEDRSPD